LKVTKIVLRGVLFDLDGTLLDTLTDIADATNAALSQMHFPTHPVDSFRYFVGDSVLAMVERSLPPNNRSKQQIEKCCFLYSKEYAARWSNNTKPYPGIIELLGELEKRKIPKAILSNKPDEFTKPMVARLLPDFSFDVVVGINPSIKKKPDPSAALDIARRLGIPPEKFLYLGDTNTDMQTAIAAGMFPAGALWGFRDAAELLANGAEILVAKPLDVLKLLNYQENGL
jgi:phosphoglycolate phosphatase